MKVWVTMHHYLIEFKGASSNLGEIAQENNDLFDLVNNQNHSKKSFLSKQSSKKLSTKHHEVIIST